MCVCSFSLKFYHNHIIRRVFQNFYVGIRLAAIFTILSNGQSGEYHAEEEARFYAQLLVDATANRGDDQHWCLESSSQCVESTRWWILPKNMFQNGFMYIFKERRRFIEREREQHQIDYVRNVLEQTNSGLGCVCVCLFKQSTTEKAASLAGFLCDQRVL